MNVKTKCKPSQGSQQKLDILHQAVNKALYKKYRLGQYAVIWQDGKPIKTRWKGVI